MKITWQYIKVRGQIYIWQDLDKWPWAHRQFNRSDLLWTEASTLVLLDYESMRWSSPRLFMMTSSNGNVSRVTDSLCGEFTGHRWIPRTKASDAELWCFLWSAPWINGWDAITFIMTSFIVMSLSLFTHTLTLTAVYEVKAWVSNCVPFFYVDVISYPCLILMQVYDAGLRACWKQINRVLK